jgi:hypothetical protein
LEQSKSSTMKWRGIKRKGVVSIRHCDSCGMLCIVVFRFEDVVADCDVVLDTKSYVYELRTLQSSRVLKPMVRLRLRVISDLNV